VRRYMLRSAARVAGLPAIRSAYEPYEPRIGALDSGRWYLPRDFIVPCETSGTFRIHHLMHSAVSAT
jgi:hypothetical protein